MKVLLFIKKNYIKLTIQALFIMMLYISVSSLEFSTEILQDDGKSVNYVGILRGGTQRLVKQELMNKPNDELIMYLDNLFEKLKIHKHNNHFAIHEDEHLMALLLRTEGLWIELKEEIYNHRNGADPICLYYLSESYYEVTNNFVFETQKYVESKVHKLDSLKERLLINVILILLFSAYQVISKIRINDANDKLNNIAYIDSLTGLSNRAHCNEIISSYNQMDLLPKLVCVYFDLNNLKITNDVLGHEAGDKLLKDFAKILKDGSEPYGFVCRNGGDEFVAIFENCTLKNVNDYINYLN